MPRALRAIGTKNRSKPGKCERRESNPYTQTGNRNLNPARLPISPLSLTKSSAKPPQRQTAAATLYTHALRLMQVFFASPRFLPLFWDALCRCRSIRAFFGGARSMSLSLHTSFFWGRPIGKADTGRLQLRYCPQAANTLRYRPIACGNTGSRALYVAIAPYELGGRLKPLLPSSKTAASAMNGRYKARLWMIA